MNLEKQRDALMERAQEVTDGTLNIALFKSELMATLFAAASEAMAEQREKDAAIAEAHSAKYKWPEFETGDVKDDLIGAGHETAGLQIAEAIRRKGEA